uniref:Lipid membrane protein n=1 Tax=Marseillevirus LCMAC103 TaxID=2506604 RepID=A0A481YUY1_9VIRU|nr:MAG: lipid membrane protein [Marseillevirus LCMAC103]
MSKSSSKSVQEAESTITQRYQGTCNIRCDNAITDSEIVLIGADVAGDVRISQSCTLDGQCLFNNTMDAVSDVVFAAENSSNAHNAGVVPLMVNIDVSETESRQSITQRVSQAVSNTCDLTSTNAMNNVRIFAANSNIGGSVSFAQDANTEGQCVFESTMAAATMASATALNTSESGKDKKGGKLSLITSVIGVIILLGVFGVLSKRFAGGKCPDGSAKEKCAEGETHADGRACGPGKYYPCKAVKKPKAAAKGTVAKKPKAMAMSMEQSMRARSKERLLQKLTA